MLATDAKTQKIKPDPNFFMMDESFGGSVNVIDTLWGRIYIFNVQNFRLKFQTRYAMTCFRIQQQHPFVSFIFVSLSCQLQFRERAVSWRRRGWLKGSVGSEEDRSTAVTTRATEQVIFHDKSHMVMQLSEPIKHAHSISIKLPAFFVILGLSIDKKNH